jgi:hypothetical protein
MAKEDLEDNFLILILHSYNTRDRLKSILKSWGKNANILFYADYSDFHERVMQVTKNPNYEAGPEKILNCIKFLPLEHLNYDWYVFCDDDTFLNLNLLEKTLPSFDKNFVYCDIIKCWDQDPTLEYPSGGAGFAVPNSVFKKLRFQSELYDTKWSDVCLGLNFKKLNINMKQEGRFHAHPPHKHNLKLYEVPNHISFHYIEGENQKRLHDICQLPEKIYNFN